MKPNTKLVLLIICCSLILIFLSSLLGEVIQRQQTIWLVKDNIHFCEDIEGQVYRIYRSGDGIEGECFGKFPKPLDSHVTVE